MLYIQKQEEILQLKFTPLEFETPMPKLKPIVLIVKIYSVGV